MNSSSVAPNGVKPSRAASSTCARSTCRGDWRTGVPSSHDRSHWTIADDGSHGAARSVAASGVMTKSP